MILKATILFFAAAAIAAAAAAANTHQKKKPNDPQSEPEEDDDDDDDDDDEEGSFLDAISSIWSEAEEKIVAEDIEDRKAALKTKLLTLYLHKEKKSCVLTLRRDVEEKIGEIGMLELKLKSLEAEVAGLVVKQGKMQLEEIRELELGNKTVQYLQKRLKLEADSNRMVMEKLKIIQENVSALQDGELCQSQRDAWVDEKLRGFELETLIMKRKNKELEMGKRVLSLKLVSAQETRAKFDLPNLNERELPSELEEELETAKQENDDLLKQVDTLQKSRFIMVEELVYQRWLNTCLKLDSSGKPWRRQSSSYSETDTNSSFGSSSPSTISRRRSSTERSTSLIRKIKNWGKSKNDFRARRFSTSMIPSKPLSLLTGNPREAEELRNRGIAETPTLPRKRRVSFNDHVSIFELTHEACADEELWATEQESGSDTEYPTPPDSEIGIDEVISKSSAETDFEIREQEEVTKLDDDMVRAPESEEGLKSRDAIVSNPDRAGVEIGIGVRNDGLSVFLCFCFVVLIVVALIRLLFAGN